MHIIDPAAAPAAAQPAAAAWPRPWDPTSPSTCRGSRASTAEQQQRATKLVQDTLADLPRYADPAAAEAAGYTSIGDAGTGSEHFIRTDLIEDDDLLDPLAPESLVYSVQNGQRTLAGAMYIASSRPADDPSLTDWAGPLMTWHKHDNLCWGVDENGAPKVVGIIDANGNCANGVRTGDANPMVHVWIQPHPCGVFAALEGIGAGTAGVPRINASTSAPPDTTTAPRRPPPPRRPPRSPNRTTRPSRSTSAARRASPQQQAAAENIIAVTLVRPAAVEPTTTSPRPPASSHRRRLHRRRALHQRGTIDDDVILDPNHPESLVYEPQPDGGEEAGRRDVHARAEHVARRTSRTSAAR